MTMYKKRKSVEHSNSLCWKCAKAYGKCNWSRAFVPVKNWNAQRRDLTFCINEKIYTTESYYVYECPEFKKEN